MTQVIRDYYKILKVSPDADSEEIKKAYKKAAQRYHPDINKQENAEKKFKLVNEAYEVLSNNEKRKKYDELRNRAINKNLPKKTSNSIKTYSMKKSKSNGLSKVSNGIKIISELEQETGIISSILGKTTGSKGSRGRGKHLRKRYGRY
jgi:curved DNA-binding protein CbpA